MVPWHVQSIALLTSICYLALILRALRASRLTVRQSLGWLFSACLFIVISVYPSILLSAGALLGFAVPSNALFLIWCVTLTVLLFYQSVTSSKQSEQIRSIAQAMALLRLEVERGKNSTPDKSSIPGQRQDNSAVEVFDA